MSRAWSLQAAGVAGLMLVGLTIPVR